MLPGADRLVRHLHAKGIPIAIATGSDKESYDIKVARHQEFIRYIKIDLNKAGYKVKF